MSDNPRLCTLCKSISLNVLTSYTGYPHHASYQELESCAQQCSLCDLLTCALKQWEGVGEALQQRESSQQISLGACDGGYVGLGLDTNLTHLDIQVGRERYARLQLFAAADDPAATSGVIAGRQISDQPDSDANFQLVGHWLRECLTKHRYCSSRDQLDEAISRLPTRVIDVTYQNPRLVESQGESSQYVALSHCWGKFKTVVTDTSTLSSRKKDIEFCSLPKTFQDAIIVTRRLGYRYLWIDSLCIVQDSPSDWQREAAMMGDYYGHAHLTISATSADGDHVGFLNARTPGTSNPVKLTLDLPNGEIGTVFVALGPANAVASAFYRNVERSPSNTRAWILQERALSRRVLHYAKEQVFWECRSFELSEDGSVHSRGLSGPQRGFGAKLWMLTDSGHSPKTDDARYENMIRYEWQTLVEAYTKRSLTKPSDKLPAISGLAHRAPAMFRTQYCAGLWESGVRYSLDWVASNPSEPLEEYRAPSWSWAAVDSKVSFTDERSLNEKTPVFAVENVDVELLGEDEYGQIKSASLTVHGHILSLNSTHKLFCFRNKDDDEVGTLLEDPARADKAVQLEITDTDGGVVGWVAPDRTLPGPHVLPCLILYRCRDKYNEEYYSVIFLEVVNPENSPTCFRRFGRGSVWDIDIESAKEQLIVLY